MDVTNLLQDEAILLDWAVDSKEGCLNALADRLVETGAVADKGAFLDAVLRREAHGSTGVGFGLAIPHGKSSGVVRPGVAFARLKTPLDWGSLDGAPVTLVFLLAVPEAEAGNTHLQLLAQLARKVMDEGVRQRLQQAKEPVDVRQALAG